MRIHSITRSTLVNGPGDRTMIHFQGCTLACPGCFNTSTHSKNGGTEISVSELINQIPATADGVTISGGEPFLQSKELYELVTELRSKYNSIVLFSGFYFHEIKKMAYGAEILSKIDVLIDGRFDQNELADEGLRGSSNQTIHLLTERHTLDEFKERSVEITIDPQGILTMTGFPSSALRDAIDQA